MDYKDVEEARINAKMIENKNQGQQEGLCKKMKIRPKYTSPPLHSIMYEKKGIERKEQMLL
jgi:hypothetical protein